MVSHNLNSLKNYCDAAIYVGRNNHVDFYDNVTSAIEQYLIDEK